VLVLAGALFAGCSASPGPADDPNVVAMVGKTPITADTVRSLLAEPVGGAPVEVAGVPAVEPRRQALDRAVRDELFALEAGRLGLAGGGGSGTSSRAARIQSYMERERAAGRFRPEDIDEARARAYYAERRDLFDDIDTMDVTWAKVGGEEIAKEFLRQGAGLDKKAFADLLTRHQGSGVATTGSKVVGHDDKSVDVFVRRIAFALRARDKVGIVLGDKGDWWIARLNAISFHRQEWNPELAHRVQTAVSWETEQQRFAQLNSDLQKRWPVTVFDDRLRAIKEES
jgi:hypothetical protein